MLAEEAFYLLAAGRPVALNPFMAKWLAETDRWDQTRLVSDIRRQSFELIELGGFAVSPRDRTLTPEDRARSMLTRSRFTPEVLQAIDGAYEVRPEERSRPGPKLYYPKPVPTG